MDVSETPRTLIRELARRSTDPNNNVNERPPAVPRQDDEAGRTKRQRGGGGAMAFSEKETPRRLIAALGKDLSTASGEAGQEEGGRKKGKKRAESTGSSSPKDGHAAIRRFVRVAQTDSREKSGGNRGEDFEKDEWFETESDEGKGLETDEGEEREGEKEAAKTEEGPMLVGIRRRARDKKEGTIIRKRFEARRLGEIPYLKTTNTYKTFLGALPRPNRPTPQALEAAHAAMTQYLERCVKDYARLARIDDVSVHNLTKARLEQLLREQGLLVRPLGDEIRRLLDREDADKALELPVSRARASRV